MATSRKRTILITGATSGIGEAIALSLGQRNTVIIAVGRNKKKLSSLRKHIIAQGGVCHTYSVDLSKRTGITKLCRDIKKKLKTVHWIIYAAGAIEADESMDHIRESAVKHIFAVNIYSILFMTSLLLPIVKRGGFVHISSTAGIWGNGRKPIYAASKGALNTYGKSLAWYFKDNKELSSIVVCPGPTNTPMRQKAAGDAKKHQSPEVIAKLVREIVSGKTNYRNGDIVIVRDNRRKLYQRL